MIYSYRIVSFLARAVITLTHLTTSPGFPAMTRVWACDNYRPSYPGNALKNSFPEGQPMRRRKQALLSGSFIHKQHLGTLRYQ